MMTQQEKYAREEAFLKVVEQMYTYNNLYEVGEEEKVKEASAFLSEDFHFSSPFVPFGITSKQEYIDFMPNHLYALHICHLNFTFAMRHNKETGKPYLFIVRITRFPIPRCEFICDCNDDGYISRLEILPPCIHRFYGHMDIDAYLKAIQLECTFPPVLLDKLKHDYIEAYIKEICTHDNCRKLTMAEIEKEAEATAQYWIDRNFPLDETIAKNTAWYTDRIYSYSH